VHQNNPPRNNTHHKSTKTTQPSCAFIFNLLNQQDRKAKTWQPYCLCILHNDVNKKWKNIRNSHAILFRNFLVVSRKKNPEAN